MELAYTQAPGSNSASPCVVCEELASVLATDADGGRLVARAPGAGGDRHGGERDRGSETRTQSAGRKEPAADRCPAASGARTLGGVGKEPHGVRDRPG